MNNQDDMPVSLSAEEREPTYEQLAAHEAGHLYVNVVLKRGLMKVTLDLDETGRRGVFNLPAPARFTDFDEFLLSLAGPRAQIELAPETLPPDKLNAFKDRLVHEGEGNSLHQLYSYTGWQHDITTIARVLLMPDLPLNVGKIRRVPAREVISRADQTIKEFFTEPDIRDELRYLAGLLLTRRTLSGAEGQAFVEELPLVKSGYAASRLAWEQ